MACQGSRDTSLWLECLCLSGFHVETFHSATALTGGALGYDHTWKILLCRTELSAFKDAFQHTSGHQGQSFQTARDRNQSLV